MSNSTRPGSYEDRLVVPLEASRRGAHRARVNPVLSLLPVLAVVIVVAAVIGVAYTLFFRGNNNAADDSATTASSTSAPATASSSAPATSAPAASASSKPASSASASTTTAPTVNKTASFVVYNGSTAQTGGLAKKANAALKAAGFASGEVRIKGIPVPFNQATHVYYAKSADKATAEAISRALGVGSVKQNATVAGQGIVVVVGDDYNNR
jgi:cytoskeletal protein RodZ